MVTADINKFERMFLDLIKTKYPHVLETVRKEGAISPKLESEIRSILEEFIPSSGLSLRDK